MTPITITGLEIDEFVFDVEITHLVDQPADPTCRDSADDFYGMREMEWHLTYSIEYDENDRVIECGELPGNLKRLAHQHSDLIEAKLWQHIDKMKEQANES